MKFIFPAGKPKNGDRENVTGDTHCQMSVISEGTHSLFSFSLMVNPPRTYSTPLALNTFTELLS